MSVASEWAGFAGLVFSLMGLGLVAGARRSAEDALSWQRQWRVAVGAAEPAGDEGPRRRRLVLAYRAGGVFFVAAGLILLFLSATGRAPSVGRAGGRQDLFAGIFFIVCGFVMSVNDWLRGRPRAPRFLDGELLDDAAPPPAGERVAAACTRGMIVLFFLFGIQLLREGLR